MAEVWEGRDGICIRDPAVIRQYRHDSYIELYFFTMQHDFDYTLTIYRDHKS